MFGLPVERRSVTFCRLAAQFRLESYDIDFEFTGWSRTRRSPGLLWKMHHGHVPADR